jgi:hypothetical protein
LIKKLFFTLIFVIFPFFTKDLLISCMNAGAPAQPAPAQPALIIIPPDNFYTNHGQSIQQLWYANRHDRQNYRAILEARFIQFRDEVESGNADLAADFSNAIVKIRNSRNLISEIDTRDFNAIRLMGGRYPYDIHVPGDLGGFADDRELTAENRPYYGWAHNAARARNVLSELERVKILHVRERSSIGNIIN